MKEHNQVKQDYATVKTTTETGVRTEDHLQRTFENAEFVFYGVAFITVVTVVIAFAPVEAAIGSVIAVLTGIALLSNEDKSSEKKDERFN
ncbi:hypothetical protein [Streptococcus sp. WB01_FAA12]|uniref:hypothetical protein n=1 Tax=Streptococcus sp. WB01_FAA12 TaxID=2725308 RepID=UPI00146AA001|nr:hypothetical protein [Streptococcus sp. WB01_FAA12]NMD83318.1 hypothetical protein [Streptococcus sp. WB01_FAA12]